jgi:hypothetical protein
VLAGTTNAKLTEVEVSLDRRILELSSELESMQVIILMLSNLFSLKIKFKPNMHAAERFEGVLEKVKECSDGLDKCKDDVHAISLKFEEVKQRRQQLFQVSMMLFI